MKETLHILLSILISVENGFKRFFALGPKVKPGALKSSLLILVFMIAGGMVEGQTTITYVMQDANFPTQYNDGGDFFNNGGAELGMWANTSNKKTVAWRTFKTTGDGSGLDRKLQVGDVFKITIAATRAYGQIGFSLNANGTQGSSWDNRISGSRMYFNTDAYTAWYVNRNGGNSSLSYTPLQSIYKDYIFTIKITSATTIDVFLTVDGTDYRAFNLTMNGTNDIDAFSVYGADMWDGDSNDNAYWKQTCTVTNSQSVQLGYYLASGTYTPGLISDGLDAGSTSTVSVNSVFVGGDAGSAVIFSEVNTYTGNTTINANATLKLGVSGVIPDASNMVLYDGTFSTGATIGFSETIGNLTLSDNSTIALGTGSHSITFGASNGVSWTSGKVLTITGWAGTEGTSGGGTAGKIYFGSGNTALTSGQLSQITFTGFPAGATLKSDGELVPEYSPAPTSNATSASFSDVGRTKVTLSWTNGTGSNRVVLAKSGSAVDGVPANGSSYTANAAFIGGDQIGTGNYVVFNGSGSTVTVTGLTAGATYHFAIFEYNSSGNTISYLTSGQLTANQTTTTNYLTNSSGSGNWSSTSVWFDGQVPSDGADVIVRNTLTLDQNASVSSLTINTGATFTASDAFARTLTITKSTSGSATTLSNSGTWANGTGGSTVIFTGAPGSGDAVHAISGTIAFQNITVNKTGGSSNVGVSFGANSSVTGTLEIGSGGFVSTAPPSSFYGANAILKFNQGGGATYDVNSGDFSWSTTEIPNYITISSGTVNLNASRTATGNLLIDGGTLTLSAGLTIQGNWTRSSGTFTPNSQLVTLSGTTNTIISTTSDASLYDLVVSKTGGASVSLSSNLIVTHNMTISSGIFTVPSSKSLTVTGALNNSGGTLTIESDGTGTGSLITGGSVSGNITAKRYIPGYTKGISGYHLLSSPVQGQAISPDFVDVSANPIPSTLDFYYWNESQNYWINIKNSGGTYNQGSTWENFSNDANPSFIVGKGYLVAYSTTQADKSFIGTPNTGDLESGTGIPALTYTSDKGTGWNLIGNPYPSAIDWDLGTWSRTNLNGSVYVQNGTTGNYLSWNGSTGGLTNGIIPAMQGFFVKADATSPSLTIPNASRVHSSSNLYKSSSNKSADNVLVFEIGSGGFTDQLYLQFSSQASQNYDNEFDAYKMFGTGDSPQIYSNSTDGKVLSINALPQISEEMSVPVNVKIINSGNHEISLSENTLLEALPILLEDKKENRTVELTLSNNYVFEATVGDQPDRFVLHFKSTGISNNDHLLQPLFYYQSNQLMIKNLESGNYSVKVSDITGRQVAVKQVSANGAISIPLSLRTGIYIVEVTSETSRFANKIFIK